MQPVLRVLRLAPLVVSLGALSAHPSVVDLYNQAWAHLDREEFAQAREGARAVIAADPQFYRGYRLLAQASADHAGAGSAEQLFQRAPGHLREYALAMLARYSTEDTRRSTFHLGRCIALAPAFAPCYLELWHRGSEAGSGRRPWTAPLMPASAPAHLADLARAGYIAGWGRFEEALQQLLKRLPPSETDPDASYADAYTLAFMEWKVGGSAANIQYAIELNRLAELSGIWEDQIDAKVLLGESLLAAADYEASIEAYESAIRFARDKGLRRSLIGALRASIVAHERTGNLRRAIDVAELVYTAHPEPSAAIRIGDLCYTAGDYGCAEQRFLSARESTDRFFAGFALRGLARVAKARGDTFAALRLETESVQTFLQIKAYWQAGAGRGNVAEHYAALGDYASAMKHARAALASALRFHDEGEIQDNLMQLGSIEAQFSHWRAAAQFLDASLRAGRRRGVIAFEAAALRRLAEVYRLSGDNARSLATAKRALAASGRVGEPAQHSEALIELGRAQLAASQQENARTSFSSALSRADHVGLPSVKMEALRALASIARARGDLQEAEQLLRRATNIADSLRRRVLEPELKWSSAGQTAAVYEDLVAVLAERTRIEPGASYGEQALAAAELSRCRGFLESLVEARTSASDRMTPEDRKAERELSDALSLAYLRQRKRPGGGSTVVESAEEKLREWIVGFRSRNPDAARVLYPEPLSPSEIVALAANRRATLIEFALGSPRSYAWVVDATGTRMFTLPARERIEAAVHRFRTVLSRPPAGVRDTAELNAASGRLYSMLLGQLGRAGLSGRVIVVPDGALWYVPIEALAQRQTPSRPVYVNDVATVSYAPSFSILASRKAPDDDPRIDRELLAFGAPKFEGTPATNRLASALRAGYASSGFALGPLPNATAELSAIEALFTPASRKVVTGAGATESAFKAERLDRYRRIHLASHAVLDEEQPQRSGIILQPSASEDGILRSNEILRLRMNADLVVLSACQTGLGKLIRGEGVVGLTRALMYAGARNVAVSLWSVNDASTAELMRLFYSEMRSGHTIDDALRAARKRLASNYGAAWAHPFYWAPFVVMRAE